MAHQIDESKALSQTRFMSGRRVIKTSVTEITQENVTDVLRKALATHELNRSEIDYLWKYYRGDQPIRHRVKDVRPEICNKIVENRANEIVSFKVGYLCGEPIFNGTCSDSRWSTWGNGADRTARLKAAGYDPGAVQAEVNKLF